MCNDIWLNFIAFCLLIIMSKENVTMLRLCHNVAEIVGDCFDKLICFIC